MKALLAAELLVILLSVPLAHAALCNPAMQQYDPQGYQDCLDAGSGSSGASGSPSCGSSTTRSYQIINYYSSSDFSNMPHVVGRGQDVSSSNVLLQDYNVDINPCATSGRIDRIQVDDYGTLTISSASGTSSASDQVEGNHNGWYSGSGAFDPQTAKVSYTARNTDSEAEYYAWITVTYQSHDSYVWDSCSSTCTLVPRINNVRVSDMDPVEGDSITVWCNASIPDISNVAVVANATAEVTPGDWNGTEQNFTLVPKAPGDLTVSCTIDGDTAAGKNVTLHVGVITPGAPEITNSTFACQDGVPRVNITWSSVRGAVRYYVYKNGTLEANVTSTAYVNRSANGAGSWRVAGVNSLGAAGANASVTFTYDCPVPSPYEVPDHFTRAYFARVGDRSVTAYWTDERVVLLYQNFVTDFSKVTPSGGSYELLRNHVQAIQLDPATSVEFWQAYTRGLRINLSVSGARPTA